MPGVPHHLEAIATTNEARRVFERPDVRSVIDRMLVLPEGSRTPEWISQCLKAGDVSVTADEAEVLFALVPGIEVPIACRASKAGKRGRITEDDLNPLWAMITPGPSDAARQIMTARAVRAQAERTENEAKAAIFNDTPGLVPSVEQQFPVVGS